MSLGYLSDWGEHILLNWYRPMAEVGLWGASYQMVTGVISLNSIFVTVLLPWLISKHKNNKNVSIFYLNEIVPTLLSFWLLILLAVIIFLPTIFNLFMGDKFKGADTVLLILGLGILTNAFSSLYSILFNLQNRLGRTLSYNFILVTLNLLLSIWLIPNVGVIGAEIGTSVSYVVVHGIYILDQHRLMKVSLYKIAMLFLAVTTAGFLLCLTTNWETRVSIGFLALMIFILVIRQVGSVQPILVQRVFYGPLSPLGSILNRILIRTVS